MVIDVHSHCVPAGLLDALSSTANHFGMDVLETETPPRIRMAGGGTTPPLNPLLSDLPARLNAMDRMGITHQLVSPFIDLTAYHLGPSDGAHYSRLVNDLMAQTLAASPDRLRGLATVPLQSGENAADELEHAVTRLHMVGVEIGTRTPAGHLDDPDLTPFWAAAEQLGCLVLVHPQSGGSAHEPYFLGNLISNPAETTMAAARLIFGGVLERFPKARVCLVHGGGFLPYQAGRLEQGFHAIGQGKGARLTRPPLELIRMFYYDTVLHSPRMTRALIDLVGAERLLLGSDYPFEMGDPDPVGTLADVPDLDDDGRALIESHNAQQLLAGSGRP